MKRQNRIVGMVVKIDLKNGFYAFAQVLDKASYLIFNFISDKEDVDVTQILNKPILFVVAGYDDIITKGKWVKIANAPVIENLKKLPMKFIQDALDPEKFELYNPNTGEIKPSNREDCLMLERAAVWEAHHIEERIRDHYSGKPNRLVEAFKIKI